MNKMSNGGIEDDCCETDALLPVIRQQHKERMTDTTARTRSALIQKLRGGSLLVIAAVVVIAGWMVVLAAFFRKDDTRAPSAQLPPILTTTTKEEWWEPVPVQTSTVRLPGQITIRTDQDSLRWGILGLGRIAHDFATALKMVGANVTAVAAGSLPHARDRARQFALIYQVPRHYGTYQELANDPNVDIVYIATTNQLHCNNTLLMLRHGKNVLVEKPMALNANEAHRMALEAKQQKRLLLTNYWRRFFPVTKYTRQVIASGRLGPLMAMHGDFGFPAVPASSSRLLNRTLGGGSMLDLGCYLVNMAVMVVVSSANMAAHDKNAANMSRRLFPVDITGTAQTRYLEEHYDVDTEMAFALQWDTKNKKLSPSSSPAAFSMVMSGQTSFRRPSSFAVQIQGTHGRLVIHRPANAPFAASLYEYEPFGPETYVEMVESQNAPLFDESYYPEQYPGGAGFVYVIQDLEKCMNTLGIPGRPRSSSKEEQEHGGCLELEELTMAEQLVTVEISDEVMRKAGLEIPNGPGR